MDRREMLGVMGAATVGAAMLGQTALGAEEAKKPGASAGFDAEKGVYVVPPLPYDYNALEPSIDEATMRIHHDKHHQAYVTSLNAAYAKLGDARKAGDYSLVKHWSRELAFQGGGHFLHCMFWENMAPAGKGGGGEPAGELADLINKSFGGVEAFRKHMGAAAAAVEGSGWGLLCYESLSKSLIVLQAEKQDNLTQWGAMPILGIDVWEHAYYLKYQNKRADYVKAWWDVVNWSDVARRLKAAQG